MSFKRIVFLTQENPFPSGSSERYRDANLARLLAEYLSVDLLCFEPERRLEAEFPLPERLTLSMVEHSNESRRGLMASAWRPYGLASFSRKMAQALHERAAPGTLLWVSGLNMGQYVPMARELGFRVILDEHNLREVRHFGGELGPLRTLQALVLTAQSNYYEERYRAQSHAIVTTNDQHAARLLRMEPDRHIQVVPHSVECGRYEELVGREGTTLLFPGNLNFAPNHLGLRWFAEEILPRLRGMLGARAPRVVAANPSTCQPEIRELFTKYGIEVRDGVPSLLPFLAEAALVIAPVRTGGGLGPKILEAMAAGRPVVSTGKAAEALLLSPSYDIWIADRADRFTTAIIRLLEDAALRAEFRAHALETVRQRYDHQHARPLLERLLSSLTADAKGRRE